MEAWSGPENTSGGRGPRKGPCLNSKRLCDDGWATGLKALGRILAYLHRRLTLRPANKGPRLN